MVVKIKICVTTGYVIHGCMFILFFVLFLPFSLLSQILVYEIQYSKIGVVFPVSDVVF